MRGGCSTLPIEPPLPVLLAPPLAPFELLPPEPVLVPLPLHLPHDRRHESPSQLSLHQPHSTACAHVSPLLGGRSVQLEAAPALPFMPPGLVPPLLLL